VKSGKEVSIEKKLLEIVSSFQLSGKALAGLKWMFESDEIQSAQEYANTVSIMRLGFNDHGPVHMRTVALNAVLMFDLLRKAGIKTSLETDDCGNFEDSLLSVITASMLHDLGMSVGRQDHELHSTILALPIIDRLFADVYKDDTRKRVILRALTLEGIRGHMGSISICSLEAGVVQVADGCDMTKGRARIPIALGNSPRVGHIHQYSANSIEEVAISAGSEKPVRIDIRMSSEVGLFQVEEVLLHKIAVSTAKPHIELYAQVKGESEKRYL
jgi:metal-dependent HD superfamily phosphatase/phosphodiesterase